MAGSRNSKSACPVGDNWVFGLSVSSFIGFRGKSASNFLLSVTVPAAVVVGIWWRDFTLLSKASDRG